MKDLLQTLIAHHRLSLHPTGMLRSSLAKALSLHLFLSDHSYLHSFLSHQETSQAYLVLPATSISSFHFVPVDHFLVFTWFTCSLSIYFCLCVISGFDPFVNQTNFLIEVSLFISLFCIQCLISASRMNVPTPCSRSHKKGKVCVFN